EVCRRENVSLLAYSPLAGGVLSGKYRGGAWPEPARFSTYRADPARGERMTRRFINEKTLASVEEFAKLAGDCNLSVAAFAIAWTLTRDFLGSTLVGATTVEQLDETVRGAGAVLSSDILAICDDISKQIMYPMG
ncbi:MAG: aldo/keto reductase, partial [bacterium]|nr:aldo/keto reductase [bacterium]